MKQKTNKLVALLVLPALAAFASTGEVPAFHPKEGSTLTKTFSQDIQITLDDQSLSIGGREMGEAAAMEISTSTTQTIRVIDVYEKVAGNRPAKLRRTYDELSTNVDMSMAHPMGAMDNQMEGSSELEGTTVVFTWDDEAGEYTVAFAEGSAGDDELLEGLKEDMDLRGFLPKSEVSVGDTWQVEAEVLKSALAPGGSLKIEPEDLDESMMMGSGPTPTPDEYLGELEGEVTAELTEIKDVDGLRIAVIEIKVNVSSAKDLSDLLDDFAAEDAGVEEMTIEAFDMENEYEGEGVLQWNLTAGVLYSFSMSCEIQQVIDMAMSITAQGQENSVEQSMYMSGTATFTIETDSDS